MALSRTNLLGQITQSNFGTGDFTSNSFTPPNNSLVVVIASIVENNGTTTDPVSVFQISDSGSHTWTNVSGANATSSPTSFPTCTKTWIAPVATGASITVTLTTSGRNIGFYSVSIVAYTGYNVSTPTGVVAGVQQNGGFAASPSPFSMNLSGAPLTTSEVFAGVGMDKDTAGTTQGAAFTEIDDLFNTIPWGGLESEVRGSSTTIAVDWQGLRGGGGNLFNVAAVAVEILADTGGAAPDIGRTTPTFHPGYGPGKSMFQTSPRSTDTGIIIQGTATLTGAGTLTALVTQGVIETSTGAGTLTNAATIGVIATPTGAGTVTDNATLGATVASTGAGTVTNAATTGSKVTATGAGVVTNSPTQGSGGNLIGGGTLNPLVTLGAFDSVTGSGVLSDNMTEQVTVSLTGAGTLTNAATIRATVSMVGAGTLTASSGQSCNMVGAGTLNATPTILAPVTMTGAGVLTANMLETATASLVGAGTVAALNVLRAPVAATGAGTLTANGTSPGSSSGEIWGVAT